MDIGIASGHIDDADVWSASRQVCESATGIGDCCVDLGLRDVVLWMSDPAHVQLVTPGTEALCDGVVLVLEDDVMEGCADLCCHSLELVDELGPAEVLGDHGVMSGAEMRSCERECQATRVELGLRMLCPGAHRHAKVVDLDEQGQRMLIDISPSERRLTHAGRTIEEDQASDRSILPEIRGLEDAPFAAPFRLAEADVRCSFCALMGPSSRTRDVDLSRCWRLLENPVRE